MSPDVLLDAARALPAAGVFVVLTLLLVLFVTDLPTRRFQRQTRRALDQLRRGMLDMEAARDAMAARSDEVETMVRSVLPQVAARQARRMAAEQALWTAMVALTPLKWAAIQARDRRLEPLIDAARRDPALAAEMRQTAAAVLDGPGVRLALGGDARHLGEACRPFVAPVVWAVFMTCRSVLVWSADRIEAAARDETAALRADTPQALFGALRLLLPDAQAELDRHGVLAFPGLVQRVEDLLASLVANDVPSGSDLAAAQALSLLDAHARRQTDSGPT